MKELQSFWAAKVKKPCYIIFQTVGHVCAEVQYTGCVWYYSINVILHRCTRICVTAPILAPYHYHGTMHQNTQHNWITCVRLKCGVAGPCGTILHWQAVVRLVMPFTNPV